MKKTKYLVITLILIFVSLIFAGCRGSGAVASGWPGITVDGDTAYVAFNQGIYSLDLADDGSLDKTAPTNAGDLKPRNPTFFHAPVILDEDTLLAGSYNNRLFKFDTSSGIATEFFDKARNRWIAKPLFEGGILYAPNANGTLYAIKEDGSVKWEFETDAAIWATPVMNGSHLYVVSQDHFMFAIDPVNGKEEWSLDLGAAAVSKPALDEQNKMLYIGTFNGMLLAINTDSGRIAWEAETNDWIWGSPTMGPDNMLFVTDLDANLYAVDIENGHILWDKQVDAGSSITGSALLVGDALIVITQSGTIASYDLNGERLWKETIGDEDIPVEFHGTPVLAGEDLILVSALGKVPGVYAFNSELEFLWKFEPGK